MPPPSLQIYLRLRVTMIFDFLITKVDRFMPLSRGPSGCRLHQDRFIRFQNIVYTSLVTDERTDRRTNERTSCLRLTVCLSGGTKAEPS